MATLLPGSYFSVKAPACPTCAWNLYLGGWVKFFIFAAVVLFLVWLLMPYIVGLVPKALRRYAALLAILLVLLPYYAVAIFFPPKIELTAYGHSVEYDFRSSVNALKFYFLNEKSVISSDFASEKLENLGLRKIYADAAVWPSARSGRATQ